MRCERVYCALTDNQHNGHYLPAPKTTRGHIGYRRPSSMGSTAAILDGAYTRGNMCTQQRVYATTVGVWTAAGSGQGVKHLECSQKDLSLGYPSNAVRMNRRCKPYPYSINKIEVPWKVCSLDHQYWAACKAPRGVTRALALGAFVIPTLYAVCVFTVLTSTTTSWLHINAKVIVSAKRRKFWPS
jgi:hypothetical protein